MSEPRFSTDGRFVSFTTSGQLAIVQVDGGVEEWLPLSPAIKGSYDWLPGGAGVVYVGVDKRLHRFHFDTLTCKPLTQNSASISGVTASPDGAQVAYVDDLARVMVLDATGAQWPQQVSTDADFVVDPAWSPDGETLVWTEWDIPHMAWDSSRVVARKADLSSPPVTVAGGDGVSVQQPRFSPNATRLTFLSDATGWLNLWSVDVATFGDARPVVEETFEHGDPLWGPGQRSYAWCDNNTVVFRRNECGWGKLLACNVATGEVHPVSSAGATAIDGNNGKIVIISSGPATPSAVVVHDLSTNHIRQIARATSYGLESVAIEPEAVSWHAHDGVEIYGRLYRAGDAAPMLVWTHGGPTAQSMATLYNRFAYFTERGWSILVVDHRGSSGWGRAYTQAMHGRWGELDVSDVASGAQVAVERGWADPSRIVAIGGSAGGFTTLLLLAKYPDLFVGGVAMYPVCDLIDLTWNTHRFEAHYNDSLVGPLPGAHDEYEQRSPKTQAGAIRAPLLLLHGSEDAVVPVSQSLDVAEKVRRAGEVVEHHVYEGEGHGWRSAATREDELERIDKFLRRQVLRVGPKEDS